MNSNQPLTLNLYRVWYRVYDTVGLFHSDFDEIDAPSAELATEAVMADLGANCKHHHTEMK